MKKYLSIFLAVLILFSSVNIKALTEKEYQEKKKALSEKLKANTEANKKDKQKILEEEGKLKDLDAQISAKQASIENLNGEIETAQNTIATLQDEIVELENRIEKKEEMLRKRIRAIYMTGNVGYISVLLNSNNINDYLSNKSMVQMLLQQDQDLIKFISDGKDEVEIKKTQVEAEKQSLEEKKTIFQAEQNEAKTLYAQKETYLNNLRSTVEGREKENEAMKKEDKNIEAEILASRNRYRAQIAGSTYVGGKVGWPLPGYTKISSPYGYRVDPITGRQGAFHLGIDIPAPYGTNVLAAEAGVVTYAGWLGTYGNLVVITHSNSLATAYAHNSSFLVSVGTSVVKGQPIARIGSTGNSTGPHCHFEVRVNGKTVNPLGYVGRKQ